VWFETYLIFDIFECHLVILSVPPFFHHEGGTERIVVWFET
jgi:hypothetical protein